MSPPQVGSSASFRLEMELEAHGHLISILAAEVRLLHEWISKKFNTPVLDEDSEHYKCIHECRPTVDSIVKSLDMMTGTEENDMLNIESGLPPLPLPERILAGPVDMNLMNDNMPVSTQELDKDVSKGNDTGTESTRDTNNFPALNLAPKDVIEMETEEMQNLESGPIETGPQDNVLDHKNTASRKSKMSNRHKSNNEGNVDVTWHKCKYCHSYFDRKSRRDSHEGVHTGKRHYKCQFCNSTFHHSWDKISHERTMHIGIGKKTHNFQSSSSTCTRLYHKIAHEQAHAIGEKVHTKRCAGKRKQQGHVGVKCHICD